MFYAQNIYFLQKNMVKEQAKGKETTCEGGERKPARGFSGKLMRAGADSTRILHPEVTKEDTKWHAFNLFQMKKSEGSEFTNSTGDVCQVQKLGNRMGFLWVSLPEARVNRKD